MNFVDFLSLIQTVALLNFAAMYWRTKNSEDFIANLFNGSTSRMYFLSNRDNYKKEFQTNCKKVDELTKNKIGDKKFNELSEQDKQFFSMEIEFKTMGQSIINKINANSSVTQSHYFEYICLFVGLYSFAQWFLLPCIDVNNESIILYIYLFLTQSMLVLLSYYFIKEFIYILGIRSYRGGNESYVQFCLIFVFIFIISLIMAVCVHRYGIYTLPLFCSTNTFVLLSILIPFIPFVGYFLLNLSVFHVKMHIEMKQVEKLIKRQNELLVNINSIYS